MEFQIPESALPSGFIITPGGTHTSRTIMVAELAMLLAACPAAASYADYESAVLDENVLRKGTHSNRQRTLRGLRELYSLDDQVLLFRALRDLWDISEDAKPMLALCCALARDSTLRSTTPVILESSEGKSVTSDAMTAAVTAAFSGQYNEATASKIGRNCASSWRQSGHLRGRTAKTRISVSPQSANVAYALLLGHLCGQRGEMLFNTAWARLLDSSAAEIQDLARAASTQGYLDYRHIGNVTEVGFGYLLRQENDT